MNLGLTIAVMLMFIHGTVVAEALPGAAAARRASAATGKRWLRSGLGFSLEFGAFGVQMVQVLVSAQVGSFSLAGNVRPRLVALISKARLP